MTLVGGLELRVLRSEQRVELARVVRPERGDEGVGGVLRAREAALGGRGARRLGERGRGVRRGADRGEERGAGEPLDSPSDRRECVHLRC